MKKGIKKEIKGRKNEKNRGRKNERKK